MSAQVGFCPKCQTRALLVPLYGEQGGPHTCISCGEQWHAVHAKKRKAGRIVVKAIKAYFAAGGKYGDIKRFELSAIGVKLHTWEEDTIGTELGDITKELLDDAIRLTHPDRHPPERHELATRVTQELTVLKPFVFPAPKKDTTPPPKRDGYNLPPPATPSKLLQTTFPCELCVDEPPFYYCNACRAEWEKRQEPERQREREQRRRWAANAKARRLARRGKSKCAHCGTEFTGKRKDARYCTAACRQAAHRERVMDKKSALGAPNSSRYAAQISA